MFVKKELSVYISYLSLLLAWKRKKRKGESELFFSIEHLHFFTLLLNCVRQHKKVIEKERSLICILIDQVCFIPSFCYSSN